MILTALIGLLHFSGGSILRFIPEVFKWFDQKQANDHEYRMTQLQLEVDKARATQQIDQVHANAAAANSQTEMDAWEKAIEEQSKPTGVAWVDVVSATVRPFITYWWMTLFTAYKIMFLFVAWHQSASLQDFVGQMWTARDAEVLLMILGFWFADRSIRKNTRR